MAHDPMIVLTIENEGSKSATPIRSRRFSNANQEDMEDDAPPPPPPLATPADSSVTSSTTSFSSEGVVASKFNANEDDQDDPTAKLTAHLASLNDVQLTRLFNMVRDKCTLIGDTKCLFFLVFKLSFLILWFIYIS